MQKLVSLLRGPGLLAGCLLATTPARAALQHYTDDQGVVLREPAAPSRVLLGDWEQADTFLVTYTETWRETLAVLVQEIAAEARVLLLVEAGHELSEVEAFRDGLPSGVRHRVRSTGLFTDTPWVRDYGPLQVRTRGGRVRWLDAEYVTTRPGDDSTPRRVARRLGLPVESLPAPIDGGALSSNGRGLCVSTLEYFDQVGMIYTARTLGLAETQVTLQRLGCTVLALVPALSQEPTKHTDVFLQFTGPWSLAVAEFPDAPRSEDALRMEMAIQVLQRASAAMGRELGVSRIPVPSPHDGLYHGYLNGIRLGDNLFLPSYDTVPILEEHAAFVAWSEALPEVRVIPIPAEGMFDLEGALHCAALGLDLAGAWRRASSEPSGSTAPG